MISQKISKQQTPLNTSSTSDIAESVDSAELTSKNLPFSSPKLRNAMMGLTALSGFSLGGLETNASAVVMNAPGTTLPGISYIDYGLSLARDNLLAMKTIRPDGTEVWVNAIKVNDYAAITDAHNILFNGVPTILVSMISFADHDNYLTADQDDAFRVVGSYIDESYGGPTIGVDGAIIYLDPNGPPLPGKNLVVSEPVPSGALTSFVGIGTFALRNGIIQTQDGYPRGWDMFESPVTNGSDPSIYSASAMLNSLMSSTIYPGVPLPGDSSGIVFYNGLPAGQIEQASGGTSGIGKATWLDYNSPAAQNLLAKAALPEPGTLSLLISSVLGFLGFSRSNRKV